MFAEQLLSALKMVICGEGGLIGRVDTDRRSSAGFWFTFSGDSQNRPYGFRGEGRDFHLKRLRCA